MFLQISHCMNKTNKHWAISSSKLDTGVLSHGQVILLGFRTDQTAWELNGNIALARLVFDTVRQVAETLAAACTRGLCTVQTPTR